MTHKLPPNLLALFAARPALRWTQPSDHAPEDRKTHKISGVAAFLPAMAGYEDISYAPTESWLERKDRVKLEKKERQKNMLENAKPPDDDPQVRGDAFKTLFVARLSYDVTEKDLEREFGRFGPIERIRIVTDTADIKAETKVEAAPEKKQKKKKKPHRGYAFIVYEREKDMKAAYKETDGIRIKDRHVLVDVERGRTVKGWKPRRLGGGLGGRGYTKGAPARPHGFAAPAGPGNFGGGFRGGFRGNDRGGFRGGGFRGDRGGYGGGRGGIGYQGGGGFGGRGGYGGGGGFSNGSAPPPNAPSGPGGRGGFGGGGYAGSQGGPPMNGTNGMNGSAGGGYGDRPRGSYDDRSSRGGMGGGGFTGSNREPVRPREGGGYGDRDRGGYQSRDEPSRKRYQEFDGYDDRRNKQRY